MTSRVSDGLMFSMAWSLSTHLPSIKLPNCLLMIYFLSDNCAEGAIINCVRLCLGPGPLRENGCANMGSRAMARSWACQRPDISPTRFTVADGLESPRDYCQIL